MIALSFIKETIFFGKGVQAFKGHLAGLSEKAFIGLLLVRLLDSFIACAPLI